MRNALILTTLLFTACDVGDAVSAVTSGVVGTTIDASKGVADGFKTGVQEGRKDARSIDGSTVLSTSVEVAATTRLWVVDVTPSGHGEVAVVLGVENITGTPLHLIGLADDGGALLIDTEGFSTGLSPTETARMGEAIAVPPHAAVKTTLRFQGDGGSVAAVRVWGQDLPVP